jgi:PPOX class probable F420-dependent enzyme
MAAQIPDSYKDILNKPGYAHLATLMKDGSPQVTPVWYDFDGTHIRVNSAKGRLKDTNMRRDKQVALSIQDPDNPYRYLAIRGNIDEITENGADDHIDTLAKKYLDKGRYPWSAPGEVRVIYKIRADKVSTMG